jgi:UDP-glucose/GDP-mannose dehydrogenase family, UDP binding domain
MDVIELLVEAGARVHIYDPSGTIGFPEHLRGALRATALEAISDADALAVLTDWHEFAAIDLVQVYGRMRGNVLLDARNFLDARAAQRAGFRYMGMGRGSRLALVPSAPQRSRQPSRPTGNSATERKAQPRVAALATALKGRPAAQEP